VPRTETTGGAGTRGINVNAADWGSTRWFCWGRAHVRGRLLSIPGGRSVSCAGHETHQQLVLRVIFEEEKKVRRATRCAPSSPCSCWQVARAGSALLYHSERLIQENCKKLIDGRLDSLTGGPLKYNGPAGLSVVAWSVKCKTTTTTPDLVKYNLFTYRQRRIAGLGVADDI
jgi:hypothetical protein